MGSQMIGSETGSGLHGLQVVMQTHVCAWAVSMA